MQLELVHNQSPKYKSARFARIYPLTPSQVQMSFATSWHSGSIPNSHISFVITQKKMYYEIVDVEGQQVMENHTTINAIYHIKIYTLAPQERTRNKTKI